MYFAIRALEILQNLKKLLTIDLDIQKEVKLYRQGKLFHLRWNGQTEA